MSTKKIVILSTGGTIAMSPSPDENGYISSMSGNDLVREIPLLKSIVDIEVIDFASIPSFHMTTDIMLTLAQKAEKILAREDVHGIIVTHGTDTLEESAYFLDLYISSPKSICVTGAMLTSDHPLSDGEYNIINAVRVASHADAAKYGTLVVMNETIHLARRVTKLDTSSLSAFQSPLGGNIGQIIDDNVVFFSPAKPKECLRPNALTKNVPIIKVYTGIEENIFDYLLEKDIDGLVVEGYGKGNLPAQIIPALKRILEKNIPIVVTSRAPFGATIPAYANEGGSAHLNSLGIILSGALNCQKARIKLMLALCVDEDSNFIAEQFRICGSNI